MLTTSAPSDGQVDVPLDFVPVLTGNFDGGTSFTLEQADGTPMTFDLRTGITGHYYCTGSLAELIPRSPFASNTGYVIRAANAFETAEVRFTTGGALVDESPLQAPRVKVALISRPRIPSNCTLPMLICVGFEGASQVEARVLERGRERYWDLTHAGGEPGLVEFATYLLEKPDCIEVRARDAAGRRSDATVVCGERLQSHEAPLDYYEPSVTCMRALRDAGELDTESIATSPQPRSEPDAAALPKPPSDVDAAVPGSCAVTNRGDPPTPVILATIMLLWRRRARIATHS